MVEDETKGIFSNSLEGKLTELSACSILTGVVSWQAFNFAKDGEYLAAVAMIILDTATAVNLYGLGKRIVEEYKR